MMEISDEKLWAKKPQQEHNRNGHKSMGKDEGKRRRKGSVWKDKGAILSEDLTAAHYTPRV